MRKPSYGWLILCFLAGCSGAPEPAAEAGVVKDYPPSGLDQIPDGGPCNRTFPAGAMTDVRFDASCAGCTAENLAAAADGDYATAASIRLPAGSTGGFTFSLRSAAGPVASGSGGLNGFYLQVTPSWVGFSETFSFFNGTTTVRSSNVIGGMGNRSTGLYGLGDVPDAIDRVEYAVTNTSAQDTTLRIYEACHE